MEAKTEAKIEFTIGEITFKGEGSEKWIAEQLDKIIEKAPKLMELAPLKSHLQETETKEQLHKPMLPDDSIAQKSLATFLQEKNPSKSQLGKFLATAVWLEAKGNKRLSTSEITKALSNSNQGRLSNPADCLNKNVKKGYCQREGKEFFVTQEGKDSLNNGV